MTDDQIIATVAKAIREARANAPLDQAGEDNDVARAAISALAACEPSEGMVDRAKGTADYCQISEVLTPHYDRAWSAMLAELAKE